MPLTDEERKAVRFVAKRFYDQRESTTHQQLLEQLKSPKPIIRLAQQIIWSTDTTTAPYTYFPTLLTFHHCGDDELLRPTKRAVEVVIRELKNLFATNFDSSKRYLVSDFLTHLKNVGYPSDLEEIVLGLFLVKDLPNVISPSLDAKKTSVSTFQISEHILDEDPEKVWNNYVQNFDRIAQEDRQKEEAEAERLALIQQKSTAEEHQQRREEAYNKISDRAFHTAFNTYRIVEHSIGSGGAGTVHLVEDIDRERYALKVLHSEAGTTRTKRFRNEIDFCSKHDHPNIITVVDHGVTKGPEGDVVPFYVMPLYPTTLRKLMTKGITPSDVLPLFSRILDGVEAAHLKGVCHRDLKPENILCDPEKSVVVIADFGIAKFREEELYTAVETSNHDRMANFQYSAPEQRIRGRQVTSAADIFAAGLILNEMFTGDIPQGTGYKRITSLAPDHAFLDEVVDQMIQQAPEQRPRTVATIKEELIARGKLFVSLQQLDESRRQVIRESEVLDSLISDPIRLVEIMDFRNNALTLRLNRHVNEMWKGCFLKTASFTGNPSSAVVSFQGDRVQVVVSEMFVQQGVDFVREGIRLTNEAYASVVKQEHQKEIERRRTALTSAVEQEEKRLKILQKVKLH